MNYINYLIYGIVQGFTEFLPISSSAHLKLLSELIGLQDLGSSLTAIVQFASVFAILIHFRKDIKSLMEIGLKNNYLHKNKIFFSILIGSLPIIFIGGFAKFLIPNFYELYLRSNFSIGIFSIFTALLMYLSQSTKNINTSLKNHNLKDSFKIGLAQSFAIIPGVSRSGITITIALLLGWKRVDAVKYSFLLGIPAILLAAFVEIYSSINDSTVLYYGPLFVALTSAFITSLISIKILMRYISMKSLKIFVLYKLFFGLLILLSEFKV